MFYHITCFVIAKMYDNTFGNVSFCCYDWQQSKQYVYKYNNFMYGATNKGFTNNGLSCYNLCLDYHVARKRKYLVIRKLV